MLDQEEQVLHTEKRLIENEQNFQSHSSKEKSPIKLTFEDI